MFIFDVDLSLTYSTCGLLSFFVFHVHVHLLCLSLLPCTKLRHLTCSPYEAELTWSPQIRTHLVPSNQDSPGPLISGLTWSPSSGKVTWVPSFQPGFTAMLRIFSLMLEVYPSSFITWTRSKERLVFRPPLLTRTRLGSSSHL